MARLSVGWHGAGGLAGYLDDWLVMRQAVGWLTGDEAAWLVAR